VKTPDVLNSKISKIRLELPHYAFSHSAEGDSSNVFIGRERTRERLIKIIEDSPDEPGVYLIAGNRGVGKTSLFNQVIKETSLREKSKFSEKIKYILLLLIFVTGIQFCLQKIDFLNNHFNQLKFASILFFIFSFILLCFFNSFKHKITKNIILKILDGIHSSFKELSYLFNPHNPQGKTQNILKIILIVCYTQMCKYLFHIIPLRAFIFYLGFVLVCTIIKYFIYKCIKYKKMNYNKRKSFNKILNDVFISISKPFKNYIKNHSRLYVRINFGHNLKEKDLLRLIARTLNVEYQKYRSSFWRMLPWRVIALIALIIFSFLFSNVVEKQIFYKEIIKGKDLYKASSQILLDNLYLKDNERLKDVFNNIETFKVTKEIEIFEDVEYQTIKKIVKQKPKSKIDNVMLVFDQLIYEITKIIKKAPKYFWTGQDINEIIKPINYLCLLLFILTYLICILLFRCMWISTFFTTHRIILRKLKKLNSDIVHSTELENKLNISDKNAGFGIEKRTKKTRDIADTREIEKELQDILSDVQRIPFIMCRPNIVIVFDELDKVESGESGSEKGIPQTKAALFSIHATSERQTEILRILSNMKYFLSSVKAKFIFIAGREMYDIHLADVSERNNYIGSIFNVAILVPSFLTDHHTSKIILQESSIASLPEEFVCRKLFPFNYPVEAYNLKNYRIYLEKVIFSKYDENDKQEIDSRNEKIQKIIAVLQQFIIYLAHLSKGAPKKMIQLFESFIEIRTEKEDKKNMLLVQRYHSSRHFLSFNYYKQYTIGILAYLITPIFYRLSESNIKEHSDKLLVSSLRFVDFLFKFHKNSFSWKHLDMSPEMLEVNRAPELRPVAVDLLNYLTQIHINKSNFSLSDYKFDGLIANEIFAMAKTDEVFSALFSFSLDETLPLKNHYKELLEKTEKDYRKKERTAKYIDAISSLQSVLGDLYYYDDGLEEAESYYKSSVQTLQENKKNEKDEALPLEQLYVYIRNMLRLGIIYEKRKQYDFAYLTYGELCKRIIQERYIVFNKLGLGVELRIDKNDNVVFIKSSSAEWKSPKEREYNDNIRIDEINNDKLVDPKTATLKPLYFKEITPNTNNLIFKKMTFEGLKMLYLSFIAKLQIMEKSHVGGITRNHLEQLDKEFTLLTFFIDHEEAKIIEAEFFSRVADILYYKNSDLKCKKNKNRFDDEDDDKCNCENKDYTEKTENTSCTACFYYHKALSILLGKIVLYENEDEDKNKNETSVLELLRTSNDQLKDNYNMKYCTVLARILSDWGNVFFSCDTKDSKDGFDCYICDNQDFNTKINNNYFLGKCVKYLDEKKENEKAFSAEIDKIKTKKDIALAMYTISLKTYCRANLYKRSSYQIYKMLRLFNRYKIFKNISLKELKEYITPLSRMAIHYLLYANEDLKLLEMNKRKKDLGKITIDEEDKIPLQNLLVDNEITRIRILVKELEFKSEINKNIKEPKDIKKYYDMRITSPYRINYSILGRIYRLWLKTKVNIEAYKQILLKLGIQKHALEKKDFTLTEDEFKKLQNNDYNETTNEIFGQFFKNKNVNTVDIIENLIAETIYCFIDISQLTETMGETYIFSHAFLGSIHGRLSFWIRQYEVYEMYKKRNPNKYKNSKIEKYLEQYLGDEWREKLSGYRENQLALLHYYKSLEMHNEGRAYHDMIDTMCYVKDDFNDRSDHFNIAEERHLVVNGDIDEKINDIKDIYKPSELYDVDNYFNKIDNNK